MECKITDRKISLVLLVMKTFAIFVFVYSLYLFVYSANKFDFRLLRDSLSEHGGVVQGLPNEVLHAYMLAKAGGLERFDVEGAFREHPLLHQRTVEFLYPIRFDDGSRDLFVLEAETISRDCRLVAKSGRVLHFECSNE